MPPKRDPKEVSAAPGSKDLSQDATVGRQQIKSSKLLSGPYSCLAKLPEIKPLKNNTGLRGHTCVTMSPTLPAMPQPRNPRTWTTWQGHSLGRRLKQVVWCFHRPQAHWGEPRPWPFPTPPGQDRARDTTEWQCAFLPAWPLWISSPGTGCWTDSGSGGSHL